MWILAYSKLDFTKGATYKINAINITSSLRQKRKLRAFLHHYEITAQLTK